MTAAADQSRTPMLDRALEYLKLGYPIFPVCSPLMGQHQHGQQRCTSPGKRPMVAWEPYQARLPTEAEVRRWWTAEPRCNIGMATGALAGVIVLDCDSGEARSGAMERGGLDRTPAVWTGKPGGIHYWLEHPGEEVRNFARRLPGTDLRGDGGYVLLPPSRHVSGADYRWNEHTLGMEPAPIPAWLWELLRGSPSASSTDDAGREALDYDEILAGREQGSRDDFLFRAAGRFRYDNVPQAAAEAMIRQAARACRPPFDEDEAVEKVRRTYREHLPNRDFSEWFEDEAAAAEETAEAAAAAEEPAPAVFLRPISELLAMPEVDPDWLVNQLFTVGSNGWVAAEPKVGKSWAVLELVYALSTGEPFLGKFAVKQRRRVVYIQEEDSLQRVLRRLKQLLKGDPSRQPPADEFLRWSIRSGFKVDSAAWIEMLRQEIESWKAEVIILDVFNRLHGSDENKQAEMTAILNALTALTNKYGCSFLIVHHNRKQQPGSEARPNQLMRGSGVLASWAECSLYLRKGREKNVFIVTPESKDAPELDDFSITLKDTENGGVVLEIGGVNANERTSKIDGDIVTAVEKLNRDGLDATVQRIADTIGKDRSSVQKRMRGLVEEGLLGEDEVQIGRAFAKIYTVTTL